MTTTRTTATYVTHTCPECGEAVKANKFRAHYMAHRKAPADATGICPDCGRRQGWDGHRYGPCGRKA
jgi:predicted RNA-binding Zn-ribbon protein involved in translation (DUF1610 family)